MAHLTVRDGYRSLADRLNRFPQGAPLSDRLFQILQILFSEREAELVAQLPIKPFTVKSASRIWKTNEADARKTLDELAGRGVLVDAYKDGVPSYVLPPPMAGFFEFSMMRVREDIDQKLLAELFEQYITVEEEFMTSLFAGAETQMGRVYVNEDSLPTESGYELSVLDYERASEVVRTASAIGVGTCYCRHKKAHQGTACDAPMEICMTFNSTADSLTRHGVAKEIDKSECMDLLQQARDLGLVQFGENVRKQVNYICNCCGCCCEALLAVRRFGLESPVHTTNYIPEIDLDKCNGCGKCIDACPVEAMVLVNAGDPVKKKRRLAKLDDTMCLGCGVCVPSCPTDAIRLVEREQRLITPLNSTHRVVVMALERGQLANLLFDDKSLVSHRLLGAMFASILRLPPIKRLAATKQVKSVYLERLVERYEATHS